MLEKISNKYLFVLYSKRLYNLDFLLGSGPLCGLEAVVNNIKSLQNLTYHLLHTLFVVTVVKNVIRVTLHDFQMAFGKYMTGLRGLLKSTD